MKAIFLLALIIMSLLSAGVAAQSYQEITTVSGTGSQVTGSFSVTSGWWRLRWSYMPSADGEGHPIFSVFIYPKGESMFYSDFVMRTGSNETSGVLVVYEGEGEYYLKIDAGNLDGYTIVVEAGQGLAPSPTVPEFSVALLAALMVAVSAVSVLHAKKRR